MTLTLVANINRKPLWSASTCKTAHLAHSSKHSQGKQTEGWERTQPGKGPNVKTLGWQHLVRGQRWWHAWRVAADRETPVEICTKLNWFTVVYVGERRDQRNRCFLIKKNNYFKKTERSDGEERGARGVNERHCKTEPTCFLLYFTQDVEESRFHSVAVQCMFPKRGQDTTAQIKHSNKWRQLKSAKHQIPKWEPRIFSFSHFYSQGHIFGRVRVPMQIKKNTW